MNDISKNPTIQHKLMRMLLITCGSTLLMTCAGYFGYEYFNFRKTYFRQLSNTSQIIASNTTAALLFDDHSAAGEILSSLKVDPHVVGACLYDKNGKLFAKYPADFVTDTTLSATVFSDFQIKESHFEGYEPVLLDGKQLGTVYLKTDMKAMYELFAFFGLIAMSVFTACFIFAILLSKKLQKGISKPIMALAETSKAVSENRNYSVRATKYTNDELGLLTDAFNQMLSQIEIQNGEIISLNENLEQKIEERTKELKAATKEMEAFSYSISHDLRAPLRAVDGYANILEEDYANALDDEGKRVLHEVRTNARKMGNLIDDLLAFSRLGRKGVLKTQVDMKQMVETVLNDMKNSTEHHATIKINSLPASDADYSLLYQVWVNLISNALKYSGKREQPVVEIGSTQSEQETLYYVKDNGVGFEMQYVNKLFGVFQRLHTNDEFEGTGVGLAIVQRIIQKHGGKVWAEAKMGEGASFYFSLPSNN